jgi:uncharacterized protein (TIGR00369 family)
VKQFKPKDLDFQTKVRHAFSSQSLLTTLGMQLERVEPGCVTVTLPFGPHILQQHGFIHGGAVAAMGDTACGFAAMSLMPADCGILTVEFKISLMSPAQGKCLVAVGRVVKPGRTLIFSEAEISADQGTETRLIARTTATLMLISGRDNIVG